MRQITWIKGWLGVELSPIDWKEKGAAIAGGLIAISLLVFITHQVLGLSGAAMLIPSMGASAVLLFAVPHGPLSQPWPVLGGHGLSTLIGVICAQHIPNIPLAAGCAVGLAIGVMQQLKCIHPPAGASALIAVVGGPTVHALGFSFIWSPVLLNALVMVAVAVLFNSFFPWRRYPAFWNRKPKAVPAEPKVTHEEVVAALESFDSFIDVTEDDLVRLHQLLSRRLPRS